MKRTAQLKVNVPPELRDEFKDLVREECGNVVSVSAYLFGMIEDKVRHRQIQRQRTVRYTRNS